MKNIFTVDIEELHHRFAYSKECEKSGIKFDGTALEGVIRFIRLLNKYGHTATFFVVGEILAKYPIIGKLIVNNGHEIANHTYSHTEFKDFKSISDFEKSIDKTDKLISKICKVKNIGFRAPKWNLPTDMNKIVKILIKRGYLYDSSLFPAKGYGYGTNKSICYPYRISSNNFYDESQNEDFFEMPTLVYQLRNWRIPIKLRHFGLVIQKRAIKKMNDCGHPAVITLHTWEIIKIPEKFKNLGTFSKNFIRNYRIPAFSQIEDILKNYEFESISKYLSGRVDKK